MTAHEFAREAWRSLDGAPQVVESLTFTAGGALPSAFPVTDLASGSVAAAALAIAELGALQTGRRAPVTVDRRLASFWFAWSLRPRGWKLAGEWDTLAGDYAARDGWVRLHTNAPHHRLAAQKALGSHDRREDIAAAISMRTKAEVEAAVVAAGGCAAEMRSLDEWSTHPQGLAVAAEPLIALRSHPAAGARGGAWTPARPLAGVRVLDLTRVLAGPVATRFLAGFGAEVLRIDPPWWDEPTIAPEIAVGKRCARLDLAAAADRATFETLLAGADVLVHGYRADALDWLGYGAPARQAIAPGLVDVSLDAYGWSGPWRERRGFDSLVQMSAGIAHAGMRWKAADRPTPLPVQALDHATGYLMAAAAVRGLALRRESGVTVEARLSLARTAALLSGHGADEAQELAPETHADRDPAVELTAWGPAQRLYGPVRVGDARLRWDTPAAALGSAPARWRTPA